LVTFPNAKINIGLNLIEKRSDGFHNIESCFYPIGWTDVLEISKAEQLSFKSTGLSIPGNGENNLCLKAFNLLKADFPNIENIAIRLHKVVPIGAGMGGGSADGAFALKMINDVAKLNLDTETLQNYARKMGSDCAFFIENKPKFCFEKGDVFEGLQIDLKGYFIVLVNPNIHISTAEAYAGVKPKLPNYNLKEALKTPIENWKNCIFNGFEESIFLHYPILNEIKTQLYQYGAIYSSMTGSGSTMYGIFENEIMEFPKFDTFQTWSGFLN
jgi:4-diphosphocytidyl-2-C-methyl-D-erythritol kinase